MIDRICTNQHRVSQNLIESYLLDNLENEFKTYKIRVENVKQQKRKRRRSEQKTDRQGTGSIKFTLSERKNRMGLL